MLNSGLDDSLIRVQRFKDASVERLKGNLSGIATDDNPRSAPVRQFGDLHHGLQKAFIYLTVKIGCNS